MKKIFVTTACSLAILSAALGTANAQYLTQGYVVCDVNTNNVVDSGDVPLPNITVVVTNSTGTYSNSVVTTASGAFSLNLPVATATYRSFISPLSVPLGTTLPVPFDFSLSAALTGSTNTFLVHATNCGALLPNDACWLQGGGAIKAGKGRPEFTFGLDIAPNCSTNRTNDLAEGHLNVVAHNLKLRLKGTALEVVNCGTANGTNYIDFQGIGEVKGIAGNRVNYGLVQITGRITDGGSVDSLYLRAYTDAGQTVLLISSQMNNAASVAPRRVTNGDVVIYSGNCLNPPPWWHNDNEDEDDDDHGGMNERD